MINNRIDITLNELIGTVSKMKTGGCRFVTISCADNRDGTVTLYYHFDKNLELTNVVLTADKDDIIPSITNLYLCAFLAENETKELFGLNIENIAIDYEGRLYLTEDAPEAPMAWGGNIIIEKKEAE